MRRNLFVGIPNDKLKECYESYKRVQCKREEKKELFSELVMEYETEVGEKLLLQYVSLICLMKLHIDILRNMMV